MASIRKRAAKQYQARIRVHGFPPTTRTFPTRQEAERWADQHEQSLLNGVATATRQSQQVTLKDALQRYAEEVSPEKKGHENELRRIKTWQRNAIAVRPIAEIRGADMARYRDLRLAAGAGGNTIRLELAIISHLFEVARKDWGYEELQNPVKAIRKPKVPRGRDRRFLPGEEAALMKHCEEQGHSKLAAVITLAVETAMRRSELVALDWQDVDLKARMAHLHDTKNGDRRIIPLSTKAVAALESLRVARKGPVVDLHKDVVTYNFLRACKACGIQGLRFHDLRHEATSRLFEKGFNMMEVSTITGHRSLSMLKRYTHLKPASLLERLG